MIKKILSVLFAGVFFLSPAGCLAAKEAVSDGKTLFENTCGKCHSIDRPKAKKKTKSEWETTVLRMKKNGATLTDAEARLIIDYLANTYKK